MKSGEFIETPVVRDWFNLEEEIQNENFNQKSSWMNDGGADICDNLLIHFYQR